MPVGSSLQHRYLETTALGYVTNNSPTSTDPVYQAGANAMFQVGERFLKGRPGFATELIPGPYAGTIRRIFTWRKWGGSFFGMVCSTDSTSSYVYKYEFGVDAAAVLIHTDSASTTPFDFYSQANTCYFGNGHDSCRKYEGTGTTVYLMGIVRPSLVPTYTTGVGALSTIAGGSFYFYTYVRETNNHESSPSDASACTGNAASLKYTVTVQYSADPQVSHIYLYRSTDGGGDDPATALYVSKVANVTGTGTTTIADEALDTAIGDRNAPAILRNDPPPPLKGFVGHANRILGFTANKVWYSGFEEINFDGGVPEECWPSDGGGNYRPYAQEVNCLVEMSDGVAVFLSSDIHKLEGDSLDTFRFYKLSAHQGCRSVTAAKSFGGLSVHMDSSSSVWLMGGDELSLPIRPDIAAVDSTSAQLCLHFQNSYRWVCVLDTVNNKLFIMDSDLKKWFVPWTFAHSVTAIASGETAAGVFDLMIAYNNKIYKMTPSLFTDGEDTYASYAKTNLFDIVAGYNVGENINLQNATATRGVLNHVSVERNNVSLSDCRILFDDDTAMGNVAGSGAGYRSIVNNRTDPPNRVQGTLLQEDIFNCASDDVAIQPARRCSFRFDWTTANWALYSIDVAYYQQGR